MGSVHRAVLTAGGECREHEPSSWDLGGVALPQVGQGADAAPAFVDRLAGCPQQMAPCRGGGDVAPTGGPELGVRVAPREQVRGARQRWCERRERSVLGDEEPRTVLLREEERRLADLGVVPRSEHGGRMHAPGEAAQRDGASGVGRETLRGPPSHRRDDRGAVDVQVDERGHHGLSDTGVRRLDRHQDIGTTTWLENVHQRLGACADARAGRSHDVASRVAGLVPAPPGHQVRGMPQAVSHAPSRTAARWSKVCSASVRERAAARIASVHVGSARVRWQSSTSSSGVVQTSTSEPGS